MLLAVDKALWAPDEQYVQNSTELNEYVHSRFQQYWTLFLERMRHNGVTTNRRPVMYEYATIDRSFETQPKDHWLIRMALAESRTLTDRPITLEHEQEWISFLKKRVHPHIYLLHSINQPGGEFPRLTSPAPRFEGMPERKATPKQLKMKFNEDALTTLLNDIQPNSAVGTTYRFTASSNTANGT